MTSAEILEKLKGVVLTVKPGTDTDKVGAETKLVEDLGLDSLTMILVALSIENTFGIQVANDAPFRTVDDVVGYISSRL